jgi:hypothetical protein
MFDQLSASLIKGSMPRPQQQSKLETLRKVYFVYSRVKIKKPLKMIIFQHVGWFGFGVHHHGRYNPIDKPLLRGLRPLYAEDDQDRLKADL